MMLSDRRGSGYELRPVYRAPGAKGASGATGYTKDQWVHSGRFCFWGRRDSEKGEH
jgi:excisionase family DNA binding protein